MYSVRVLSSRAVHAPLFKPSLEQQGLLPISFLHVKVSGHKCKCGEENEKDSMCWQLMVRNHACSIYNMHKYIILIREDPKGTVSGSPPPIIC